MKFRYENLEVWQLGMQLVENVYHLTKKFPKEELYGLTSQIRRSVILVVLNIAEGSAKISSKEFRQFIRIAIASLLETDTACKCAIRLKYIVDNDLKEINSLIEKIYFKLIALEKSIKK